jgi:Protein of unknown function (DUF3108)
MWNKLLQILQETAFKRLAIAIVISAVLHTLFFGNVDFSLPSLKKEMHLIEARIQMPKAVPKAEEVPVPEPVVEKSEPEPIVEKAEPEPEVLEPKVEDIVSEPSTPEPVAEITPSPVVKPETPAPAENIELNPTPEPAQQEDIGLVINENAYQYIETEFDVRTKIDGSAEGKATITYNLVEGTQYQIRWLTQGSGFSALIFPDLLQTSEGALTKTGLQPASYVYQFGKKADKARSASFDWQAKKVALTTSKGTKTEDLPDSTQDLLSFMYQFMHVAPLQHMQLPIVNGKKLRIYDYSFEGEEQINSELGELKTLHILHSGSSEEEKTELWLAIDYQYVPVKIRKIESDGKVVEMVATRITTNRPVIN